MFHIVCHKHYAFIQSNQLFIGDLFSPNCSYALPAMISVTSVILRHSAPTYGRKFCAYFMPPISCGERKSERLREGGGGARRPLNMIALHCHSTTQIAIFCVEEHLRPYHFGSLPCFLYPTTFFLVWWMLTRYVDRTHAEMELMLLLHSFPCINL
jgi:hypothetical protein